MLYAQQPQAEGGHNDEGDVIVLPPPVWSLVSQCRDEENTEPRTFEQVNGENVHPRIVIYAPKNAPKLDRNTRVIVTHEEVENLTLLDNAEWLNANKNIIRVNDTVKGSKSTRLNVRIWA